MSRARTVTTIAALTLREASRRKVVLALVGLTLVLLLVSGWGFARLADETLTSGEARLTASILLNLVMFGFSLIAALGTAFLVGIPSAANRVGFQTIFQRTVPDRYMGRASGALGTTTAILSLVSVLGFAGALGEIVGIVPMLNVAAGITMLAGVVALALLPRVVPQSKPEVREQEAAAT